MELFAGVGGLRLGLERSSNEYRTVWANQWEPGKKKQHAFDCYQANFGLSDDHSNEDIAKVKQLVPEHDLLTGGFPCQDYSVARTSAKGIEGKKGVLWWEIRDIIAAKHPTYVLLENVDRLIKSPATQRGRDFGIILRCLHDLGYSAEWRVVNAAEYGHPQKRRRVFIFASRNDTIFTEIYDANSKRDVIYRTGFFAEAFPIKQSVEISMFDSEWSLSSEKYPELYDVSKDFHFNFKNSGIMHNGWFSTYQVEPNYSGRYATLRDVLEKEEVDESFYVNGNLEKWEYLKGSKNELRYKPNGEPYYYTEGAIPYPDNLDTPARTMLTSEASVNRSSHIIKDPRNNRLRVLTQVECERLNEFPDNWTKTGMPERFRYFVMGNALVVGLIETMGKTLSEFVKKERLRQ